MLNDRPATITYPNRRRVDYDMARALRAEGVKVTDIADLYGVCHKAIVKVVRGIVCPIDHHAAAFLVLAQKGRARKSEIAAARRRKIVQLRASGKKQREIAKIVGICRSRVAFYAANVKPIKAQPARVVPLAVTKPANQHTVYPAWIIENDLAEDYRDHARLYGKDAAVRFCRELLAEAMRP